MSKRMRTIGRVSPIVTILFLLAASLPGGSGPSRALAGGGLLQFTSGGYALGFEAGGMVAATGSHVLRVDFVGAEPVRPQADSPAAPAGRTASLGQVTYPDLWKGISLAYSSTGGGIYTTTYTLAPGADPGRIRLSYNAPLELSSDGSLGIAFQETSLRETAPVAWQEKGGERIPVEVAFDLTNTATGQLVGFQVGGYERALPLTIDPTLLWTTFLGSPSTPTYDNLNDMVVDGSGNIYVTGTSSGVWGTPVNGFAGADDAYVAKLNSSGVRQWSTFLGSNSWEYGYGIAVDGNGNVYVAGESESSWGTPINPYAGGGDVFVAKLNSSGQLLWNTFLGSGMLESCGDIAVDSSGNAYVAGTTAASWGYPPIDGWGGGYYDGFVAKLNANGTRLWHTFLGGKDNDAVADIKLDGKSNLFVTGNSYATWGSPKRAYTAGRDAFAAKLSSAGARLWNTFLGGSAEDFGSGIAVDPGLNVYVAGSSRGTWGSPLAAHHGEEDAYIAKLDPRGGTLWHTFIGSADTDGASDITADTSGNIYISGSSWATWGSPDNPFSGLIDAYAAEYTTNGAWLWNTFLGSDDSDYGDAIAISLRDTIVLAGMSYKTWGAPLNPHGPASSFDGFVAKWARSVPPTPSLLSPSGIITDTTPDYTWKPSGADDYYDLMVYEANNPVPIIQATYLNDSTYCLTSICSIPSPNPLTYGTYRFKVRAGNAYGWSAYSTLRTFAITDHIHSITLPLVVR